MAQVCKTPDMDALPELTPQEISQLSLIDIRYLLESNPLLMSGAWHPDGQVLSTALKDALLDALTGDEPWPSPSPLPLRVGRYAESLLNAVTGIQSDAFEPLARNLQIFEGRQTIGELDLVTSQPGGTLHVELAVKLYLGLPEYQEELDGWVGPNPRDTLGKKYRHLRDKQLPLSDSKPAKQALSLSDDHEISQQAWIKGYLFHYQDRCVAKLPEVVNDAHHRGWWTLDDEDWSPAHQADLIYCIPPKPFWIYSVPSKTTTYSNWDSVVEAAKPQIAKRLTAHIAVLKRDTREVVSRGFIASRAWLEAARNLAESLVS